MQHLITYLVEDNPVVLTNLIEALSELARLEITAHSASQAEASQWLQAHQDLWHLAIVDLFLKQGNGLGVLAACRDRAPHQKVVILTNYATPEIRERSLALGADAVFDKSTELDRLLSFCAEQTFELSQKSASAVPVVPVNGFGAELTQVAGPDRMPHGACPDPQCSSRHR